MKSSSRRREGGKNCALVAGSQREPDVAARLLPQGKSRKKLGGLAVQPEGIGVARHPHRGLVGAMFRRHKSLGTANTMIRCMGVNAVQ